MKLETIVLPMGGNPAPNLITGGQPSAADFEAMAKAGLKHIVNLRPETEDAGFDERALAAKLGLSYTVVPISGAGDFDLARARALDEAMAKTGGEPTLVHCASSNRVGGLLALRAAWVQGQSKDDAMAFGRAGGLTKMEGAVQALLDRGPA
ncbi:MAG: beta-lactamase hydrolase domain-containing protein [Panacagrimonas sp.]